MRVEFDPTAVLARLGAAGALLTCLVVVLNVGDFARPAKPDPAQAHTGQTVSALSVAEPQSGAAAQLEPNESSVQSTDRAEPMPPSVVPVSDSDVSAAPASAKPTHVAIEGVWAPGPACSVRNFRDGVLPTIINIDGAWAGETFCLFKNQRQIEAGWSVIANCSNGREQWTTSVRLTMKGDRLIWASKRGTEAYARCAPDFLMAAAR